MRAVWVNGDGGVTFGWVPAPRVEFVKVADASVTTDFAAEARRLRWAAPHLTVPPVLGFGFDPSPAGDLAWLHTDALPGLSAVHPRWLAAPPVAVRAIGAGLRMLHDRFPVRSCPFDWSATSRLDAVARHAGRAWASRRRSIGWWSATETPAHPTP